MIASHNRKLAIWIPKKKSQIVVTTNLRGVSFKHYHSCVGLPKCFWQKGQAGFASKCDSANSSQHSRPDLSEIRRNSRSCWRNLVQKIKGGHTAFEWHSTNYQDKSTDAFECHTTNYQDKFSDDLPLKKSRASYMFSFRILWN